MATPYEVNSVLHELARELGPRKGWAVDEGPGWIDAFAAVDIAVLRRACARYLGQGASKAPNLATFRRMVASSTEATTLAGCGKCADGLREVAWHHTDPRGEVIVDTFAVRCPCRLGGRVPASVGSLDDVVARMKRSANYREAIVDPRPADLVPRGRPVGQRSAVLAALRAQLDDIRANGPRYDADQRQRKAADRERTEPEYRRSSEPDEAEDDDGAPRW